MKRLYYCTAWHEEIGNTVKNLVSYATNIATQDGMLFGLWYYPSATSKEHLRKYIKYLHENAQDFSPQIFGKLYCLCRDGKHAAVCYNSDTGEIWTGYRLETVMQQGYNSLKEG